MISFNQSPETFFVEEIPAFEGEQGGEHLYVTFRRKNLSTPFVSGELRKILKIREEEIGCAGNKDKLSTSVQTFSLPARLEAKIMKAFSSIGAEVLSASRQPVKLRMGELLGNRFIIFLDHDRDGDIRELNAGLDIMEREGLPNFFGPQRLSDNDSFDAGKRIFLNQAPKGGSRRRRFFVSVFQSRIFNSWLEGRIRAGIYPMPIDGDVLLDPASEREFHFREMSGELAGRLDSLEVHFTGPMIGAKMMFPKGRSLEIEKETVESYGVPFPSILRSRVPGTRRAARIRVSDLRVEELDNSRLALSFSLPKGSYATTLLKQCGVRLLQEEKHSAGK